MILKIVYIGGGIAAVAILVTLVVVGWMVTRDKPDMPRRGE